MRTNTSKKTETVSGSLVDEDDNRPVVRVQIAITVESMNVTGSDQVMHKVTPVQAARMILERLKDLDDA